MATIPPAVSTPLPKCAYRDIPAPRATYAEYATTLLDTIYRLRSDYRPHDLVRTGLSGGGSIRQVAVADLRAMDRAARAAGARFAVESAFRSYATQITTFAYWVRQDGSTAALRASARPGHSEHQLGTVIDFKSYGGGSPFPGDWGTTTAGKWLRTNAWKFGWVISYPTGKEAVSCYKYEPWHYRFVGRAEARSIHDSRLTTREWIWAKFDA
jgi:zinc D-Ala-D-Ala carboxypeptidase